MTTLPTLPYRPPLLPVLGTLALLLSSAVQAVQAIDCEPPADCSALAGGWTVDLAQAAEVFGDGQPIRSAEDLFRVSIATPTGTVVSNTHLFAQGLRLVPFHHSDGQSDASGVELERGDQEVAALFPPGELGFAVKHKRPANRALVLDGESPVTMLLDIKLMDSHLGVVVGVERDGAPGALTLNNPQAYDGGAFGGPHSAMLFFAPEYPSYLTEELRVAFRDNMRTMLVGLNAVSSFPLKFDGGDPLNGHDRRSVIELASMMVKAIAGDEGARDWFKQSENMLYCAELAHVGLSAGLLAPLNRGTFAPLVGEATWRRFEAEVTAHNEGRPSAFTELNKNAKVQWIELNLASPELAPAASYAPPASPVDPTALAFRPMSSSDMLDSFLHSYLPRDVHGEEVAPAQAALLRGVRIPALGALGAFELDETHPRRRAAEDLYRRLVEAVATRHGSYAAYRAALEPLYAELDALDLEPAEAASDSAAPRNGLFVPPSLWHLQARGDWEGGLLGVRFVGHGLHLSVLRREASAAQPAAHVTEHRTKPPETGSERSSTRTSPFFF